MKTNNIALVKVGGLTAGGGSNCPPIGLMTLARPLRAAGYRPHVFHTDHKVNPGHLALAINAVNPAAVLFSLAAGEPLSIAVETADMLRRPIIIGGPMATCLPEMCERDMNASTVVKGYAEGVVTDLVAGGARDIIAAPFDKSRFGLPDWESVNLRRYVAKKHRGIPNVLMGYTASRGCPYDCAFCYNRKMHGGQTFFHNAGEVIADIRGLSRRHGINGVMFHDDNMGMRPRWTKEILRGIHPMRAAGIKMRVTEVTPEFCEMLRANRVSTVLLGIESGSDAVLKRMRKRATVKQSEEAVAMLSSCGMNVKPAFIVGSPGETLAERRETLEFIMRLYDRYGIGVQINLFQPWPGSSMSRQAFERCPDLEPQTLSEWDWFTPWNNRLAATWLEDQHLDHREVKKLRVAYSWYTKSRNRLARFRFLNSPQALRMAEDLFLLPWEKWRRCRG